MPFVNDIKIKAINGSELKLNGIVTELNKQKLYPLSSLIKVDSSSDWSSTIIPFRVVDYSVGFWESTQKPEQFIIVKFINASVFVTSLSIQSNKSGNKDFPRAMTFYGSKNGHDWSTIGRTEDKTYFSLHGQIVNFPLKYGFYNYIKIKTDSACEAGTNYLCMEFLDIFGYYNILFSKTIFNNSFYKLMIWMLALSVILC